MTNNQGQKPGCQVVQYKVAKGGLTRDLSRWLPLTATFSGIPGARLRGTQLWELCADIARSFGFCFAFGPYFWRPCLFNTILLGSTCAA
eukprot:1358990-Pyramimonas_sp.AAC.1